MFKIDEKKKNVVTAGAILAIFVSIGSLFFTYCDRPPKINLKPFLAIGQITAEETSKLLSGKGKVVLVVMDTGKYQSKPLESQIETFKRTLEKQNGVILVAIEKLEMNDLMMAGPEMGLPGELYLKILQQHPDVDAIVSFVGAPRLSDDQIDELGEKIPKLVAVVGMPMGLKRYFEDQLIQVAIVPRFEPQPQGGKKPETLREWFDQTYTVVTTENYSSLPF